MKNHLEQKKRQSVMYSVVSIVVLLLAVCLTTPALAAKDYRAENYDVALDIQKDGSLIVTETINFRFDGGPFTYVFRDISRQRTDNIAIMDASMDGVQFQPGTEAGQVEVKAGDTIKATWHFAPTSNSSHKFELRYRVQGAIRAGKADTLIWRVIPENHDYSIDRSSIAITYPTGLHPLKIPTLDRTFESAALDSGYRLTTNKLDTDESATLTIQFESGSLVTYPPAWQTLQEQKDRQIGTALPYGLGAAILTSLLGLTWVVFLRRTFRRKTNNYPNMAQYSSVPPTTIAPALAARLTGSSTTFLGSLFDLARRGVLRIEEGPKKWGSRNFEVIHLSGDEQLQPHEQVFIDAFFHKAKNGRVALTDISSLAYNSQFTQALDQELIVAGWQDAQRTSRRSRFIASAGLGLILGLAVFLGGLILSGLLLTTNTMAVILGSVLMGIGAATSFVGLAGLLVAALVSRLSEEGVRQAAAWNSFAGYLRNITRSLEPITSPNIFEQYLPYAAGFGIATEWVKYFQKISNIPVPEWFLGLQSSVEDGSFVAIMAAITAADSSASAASGAGAGASGGGSSGAG